MGTPQTSQASIQARLDEARRLRHKGSNTQAVTLLEETLYLCREAGFIEIEARILGDLGLGYKNLGRFEEAVRGLRQAIDLHRKLARLDDLAVGLKNLGSALTDLGRVEESLPLYQEAKDICQSIGDLRGIATCEIFIGNAYQRLGDLDEAEQHYRTAVAFYSQLNDPINEGNLYTNMGALAHRRNNLNETIECSRKALVCYRSADYIRGILTALNNLGGTLMDQGHFDEAFGYLDEALNLAEMSGLADFAWRITGNLAEWHRRNGDITKALAAYQHAVGLLDDLRFQLQNRMNRVDFLRLRSNRYADLVRFAATKANAPTLALEDAERARSRALVEDLASSVLRGPVHLSKGWLQQERKCETQIRSLRSTEITSATLDSIRKLSQLLQNLWLEVADVEPEYIALRQGEPLSYHEIRLLVLNKI